MGDYPICEIAIDGKSIGSISVRSEKPRRFRISGWVEAGKHKMRISFTNDAWSPPEDRNLFLQGISYSESQPVPESVSFLTRRG